MRIKCLRCGVLTRDLKKHQETWYCKQGINKNTLWNDKHENSDDLEILLQSMWKCSICNNTKIQ